MNPFNRGGGGPGGIYGGYGRNNDDRNSPANGQVFSLVKKRQEKMAKSTEKTEIHSIMLKKVFNSQNEKNLEALIRLFMVEFVRSSPGISQDAMFQPLAYLLQNKTIRFRLNHCLMYLLRHFPKIKSRSADDTFPPNFSDESIYLETPDMADPEDEISEAEIQFKLQKLVFWTIKYQISSNSLDIITPIFISGTEKSGVKGLKSIRDLMAKQGLE